MKYTNCPTCGGPAKYISDNFEQAKILISAEHEKDKITVDRLIDEIESLEYIVDKSLKAISSDDLFYLYKRKKKQEIKESQIRIDEVYFLQSEETEKLQKMFEVGLKKMLGDI